MADFFEFLLVPIVGGVIGYFTNWLAIKMLFHPYNEIRVFGKRIPFTPGVIPKNKGQIAASVGRVVNDYLVTPDSLIATIKNAEIDDAIDTFVSDMQLKLCENDNSLECYLGNYHNDKLLPMANNYFLAIVKSDEFKTSVSNIVYEKINAFLVETDVKGLARKGITLFSEYITDNGEWIFSKEELSGVAEKIADYLKTGIQSEQRSINEIIPPNLVSEMEKIIHKFLPEMGVFLAKTIEENQVLNEKLEHITKKIVEDTVGSLVGVFIYKKVYQNIKDSVAQYLSNAENLAVVEDNLNLKLKDFFENKPMEIIDMINAKFDIKEFFTEKTAVYIEKNYLTFINYIFEFAGNKIENMENLSLYDLTLKINSKGDEMLKKTIYSQIDKFIGENAEILISQGVDKISSAVSGIKINEIAEKIGQDGFGEIKDFIKSKKHIAIDKGAALLSSRMNISKMVEDKINASDAKLIESVTLEIVSRELNYITLMGGVLGFIIGFVPGIVNMFK